MMDFWAASQMSAIGINMEDLSHALNLSWQGMTGIFAVMVIIALIVYLLTKITSDGPEK